jgi:hypothetical protein
MDKPTNTNFTMPANQPHPLASGPNWLAIREWSVCSPLKPEEKDAKCHYNMLGMWCTFLSRHFLFESLVVAYIRSFKDEIWATARRRLEVGSRILAVTLPLFSYAFGWHCIKCLVFGNFSLFGTHGYLLSLSVMSWLLPSVLFFHHTLALAAESLYQLQHHFQTNQFKD